MLDKMNNLFEFEIFNGQIKIQGLEQDQFNQLIDLVNDINLRHSRCVKVQKSLQKLIHED